MHFGFDVPEFWGFGIGTALLLLGLGYGGWRWAMADGELAGYHGANENVSTPPLRPRKPKSKPKRAPVRTPVKAASGPVGRRAVHILCLIQTRAGSDIALVELALSLGDLPWLSGHSCAVVVRSLARVERFFALTFFALTHARRR
jgi:hypothetical protein